MNAIVLDFPRSRVLRAAMTDESHIARRAWLAARQEGANHAQAKAAASHALKRLREGADAHTAIESARSWARARLRERGRTEPPDAA